MKTALIVVDMLKDNLKTGKHSAMEREGMAIVPKLQALLAECRSRDIVVIYANDSFYKEDNIFGGRIEPHALRTTPGAEVIEEIMPQPGDVVLPKRRFSAFFKTDLDQTLRTWGIGRVGVCGITTPFCIQATAIDAVAHDLTASILEDVSAAYKAEVHESCLSLYRKSALWPLLKVETANEFISSCCTEGGAPQ